VVYFDPPYWPVKQASFTAYTAQGFDSMDQTRLADLVRALKAKGAHVICSNSDVKPIRQLYKDLIIGKVKAPRRINSDGAGRGKVSELLISTKRIK